MAGISTGIGLASGLDYTSLVGQLMQLEAKPQTLLKARLSETQVDAAAYRAVNTSLSALKSAADKLSDTATWTPVKATSSSDAVTVTTTTGAKPGSLTFTVDSLVATHSVVANGSYGAASDPAGFTRIDVTDSTGTVVGTVSVGGSGTLADAVSAITASPYGLSARTVDVGGELRLEVSSTAAGADGTFSLTAYTPSTIPLGSPTPGPAFAVVTQGTDAQLTVGTGPGKYAVSGTTNTFSDLLPGLTLTATRTGGPVTVDVASDPSAVAAAVQSLVTAANSALSTVRGYGYNGAGSTAALRGDSTLRQLVGDVLGAVASAVGTDDSPAVAGLQLNSKGEVVFAADVFTAALAADPASVRALVDGSTVGGSTVPGVAQRLAAVTAEATDATTGTLTVLALNKDRQASDLQERIDEWDLRLELRQQTLTRQFNAMETALGTLNSQASWLSAQLGQLPSWSSSN
ncbi:flagellar hook-associated protein 2 [Geodermatophilus pulveris]|uniref:Flagellar hook-associated protein 2 n=1 Tax=Geodermatophilus pulveris TaxID=1564159 RepID=A0A239GQV9_9ACTN|nr:flagellar filament capping protein FliD [Geodermatophilus pulveris]SNS71351.1 flagellar hook-associated protein 2 [Geodermatophilus pulveris]